ncbi:hypothetical protein Tco_1434721 [Tanacetum coccineum]
MKHGRLVTMLGIMDDSDSDSEEVKNVFVEDNGKHMDSLVDDVRKNVEAPPNKTLSGRKANSSKVFVVFSPETKVYNFDRDDMIFDDMGQAAEEVEHKKAYSIEVVVS